MKFSAQEEYGLRCLMAIARHAEDICTIGEIARSEGLNEPYAAKLLSVLRKDGLLTSTRGQGGGYTLARPPGEIAVARVLEALGGRMYKSGFCERYAGQEPSCTHTDDCSLRPLWSSVQAAIDHVLDRVTLADLLKAAAPPDAPIQVLSAPPRRAGGIR